MSPPDTAAEPLALLQRRGFVHDVTDADGLRRHLAEDAPVTYYVGFDPTAPSLHVGNLVGIMAMAWLQRCGHRPIAIAGGATGRIGDPSGKDSERELLDEDTLAANLAGQRVQLGRILDLGTPDAPATAGPTGKLLDNHDWLGEFGFLEFLRDVGKHFSVNAMIAKESVKARLETREQGISFTEFSYQLLQAYDFAHLYATEGCTLQGGGSDQWGNITAGIELVRRLHGGQAYGVVWPLIERSDGRKMGKSAPGGAVWLDPEQTSPYRYYQWFYNLPDADVGRFLRLYTFLPLEDIEELERATATDPAARAAQEALATEATRILHGEAGLAAARRTTEILFGSDPYRDLDDATLRDAFDEAPSTTLERGRLEERLGLLDLMTAIGAAASNREARHLIEQGAVRLNNAKVTETRRTVTPNDLASESMLVVQVGKKRHYLARFA